MTAAALVWLPGCLPGGRACREATIAAEPGRFVEGPSGQGRVLELAARMSFDGSPVEGAAVRFAFGFTQAGKEPYGEILEEIPTDGSGTAVFRRTTDQLAVDQAVYGRFDASYRARWDSHDQVDGEDYCETLDEAPLPVDQFPPPNA